MPSSSREIRITMTAFCHSIADFIDKVRYGLEPAIVLTHHGKDVAMIVPPPCSGGIVVKK